MDKSSAMIYLQKAVAFTKLSSVFFFLEMVLFLIMLQVSIKSMA